MGVVVVGIVGGGLAAAFKDEIKTYAEALWHEFFPSPEEVSCTARDWVDSKWRSGQPQQARRAFRVLVATLDSDDDKRSQTQIVLEAFQDQTTIDAVVICDVLKIPGAGEDTVAAAAKTGREWLAKHDADVLVFGRVLKKDEALNLHFLSASGKNDIVTTPFRLELGLLKDDFRAARAEQIQALAGPPT